MRDDSEIDQPRGDDGDGDSAPAASTPLDLMARALAAGESDDDPGFAAADAPAEPPSTASEMAVQLLMRDLTRGVLPPGQKLKMRELTLRYRIGASPMREALAQLASGGFVQAEANKGFRVAPISRAHLLDLTRTRQIVEGEALRLAMVHGADMWEEEIFTSFQLLKREIERRDSRSQAWLDDYEERHHRFHRALIAACPLRTMKSFCDDLYVQMTRYRRMLKEQGFSQKIGTTQHELIMTLVVGRDADQAIPMLRQHIGTTTTNILRVSDASP